MKILVLGGNGFIGSHLVDRLLQDGHKVRVFDKYEEHFRPPLPHVDYRFADFGNRGLLENALQGIEVVYHLISTTLPKTSNDDPIFDVSSNVIETLFLLEASVRNGVRKIVFTSSGGTVYGNPVILPINENASTNPECSYGITKLMIEKYLSLFYHLYGLDYTVLRPANPYGSRQNPKSIQGVIPVFLSKVLNGEPVTIWGDGELVRDYIYISDLVEVMVRVVTVQSKFKIYNVGSGKGHTLNDIVAIIKNITNIKFDVHYKEKRSFDVPMIYLDTERARNDLSWAPKVGIKEGITEVWEFINKLYAKE